MRRIPITMFVALSIAGMAGCNDDGTTPATPGSATAATQAQSATRKPSAPVGKASLPGKGPADGKALDCGFIAWGGEFPAFYGNGGLTTKKGTIFAEHGLNIKFIPGDDFEGSQLPAYEAKQRPFLRGTYRMIGKHAVRLCKKSPELCPQIFLQMTYSAGDHLVCRKEIKDLKNLKGKKIAIQRGGPHEGFFQDVLGDVSLELKDVKIEWLKNLNGPGSPPELFKSNKGVDCAFTITPDMIALAGASGTCDGTECAVMGAHVLVSTAERRRTIADVYAVATWFAKKEPDVVRNFASAYLKSVEKVKDLEKAFNAGGSPEFVGLLAFGVETWGTEVLPNADEAHGLLMDATFVGHAGNVAFFNPQEKIGHKYFSKRSNDLALALAVATERTDVPAFTMDWGHAVFSGLRSKGIKRKVAFNVEATRAQLEKMTAAGSIDSSRAIAFTAPYPANETNIDWKKYHSEFDRMLGLSAKYTRVPISVRCHVDTYNIVVSVLRAGVSSGAIKKTGSKGNYRYFIDGKPLDMENAKQIAQMIHDPKFNKGAKQGQPTALANQALQLSESRCRDAKKAFLAYAKTKGADVSRLRKQVVSQGVGIREPVVVLPRSEEEMADNRRTEFSIVRVKVEAENPDFDW